MNTLITGNKIGTRVNAMINGSLLSKDCGTEEVATVLFEQLLKTKSDPSQENVDKLYSFINENIRIAKAGGFEHDIESGITYMEGFNTPVPQDLLDTVEEYLEKGYPTEGIINFWKLLMANPDKRVREDLFRFISEHDFSLTDKGYLVVYKTVDYLQRVEKDLAELVSNSYIKIKDSWKKSPANFSVYKEITRVLTGAYEDVEVEAEYDEAEDEGLTYDEFVEEYGREPEFDEAVYEEQWVEHEEVSYEFKVTETETLSKWIDDNEKEIEVLGTLEEMQSKLDQIAEENRSLYTDKYTHTMKIKLGEVVQMTRDNCDADPRNECSHGLHVGATKYVEKFRGAFRRNSDENESPVLVCLVNPMNVVAVPEYDSSKMRVTEYYPFARGTVQEGKINIVEQPYFENEYANIEEGVLESLLKANQEEIRLTAMNADEDERDMDEYMKILESRVLDLSHEE